MIRSRFVTMLVLMGAVSAPHAADVEGLYEARVAVADRSQAELAQGARRALAVVLVKLTGVSGAARRPELRELLSQAKRLLQQFSYGQAPAEGDDPPRALELRAQFDAEALNSALRQRGAVVWGKERPDTLVWLVVSDEQGRRVVDSESGGALGATIAAAAEVRGVPTLLPLFDGAEAGRLAAANTWGSLTQTLVEASARYQTESVLIGHFQKMAANIWEAQWLLHAQSETLTWEQQGDIPELMVEEGIGLLADALARRFADPTLLAAGGETDLMVHGIDTAGDYARVQRYLGSLDTVARLSVTRVQPGHVVFRLVTHGGQETLSQSIAFGSVLARVNGPAGGYRLLPY